MLFANGACVLDLQLLEVVQLENVIIGGVQKSAGALQLIRVYLIGVLDFEDCEVAAGVLFDIDLDELDLAVALV